MKLKQVHITILLACVWGLTSLLLLHGALFHPNGMLREIDELNGLEIGIALVSFVVLFFWLWYVIRVEKEVKKDGIET
jgi:hypothetical protein